MASPGPSPAPKPTQLPLPKRPNNGPPFGNQKPEERAETSREIRIDAATFERQKPLVEHVSNKDEELYPQTRIGNYSKGLAHDANGIVTPASYDTLLKAVNSGQPAEFSNIMLGGNIKLVNPQAGLAFDLQGADCQTLKIPPAWPVASAERAAEAIELYWMALCRDVPFISYGQEPLTQAAIAELNGLPKDIKHKIFHGDITAQTLFRGATPGEQVGPYVSQFFIQPAPFGALAVAKDSSTGLPAQQYNVYVPGVDYMMDFTSWLHVQNGSTSITPVPRNMQFGPNTVLGPRYLFDGRAGSAFVHVDELYQAYFMAALNLLDNLKPDSYDVTNPYEYSNPQHTKEAGFGTFGNPHIATLVAEVATRALKAQWYQKWFVHRTLRPEAYGGLVHLVKTNKQSFPLHRSVLESQAVAKTKEKTGTYLMPMAFPEGSPQHPSYGSGHATVAGACATIIKAFFREDATLMDLGTKPKQPSTDGKMLQDYTGADGAKLTVGGEANKIAGNVGMFRNHAGVHWRSDHEQSILLGERIAISMLQDQRWIYNEPFDGWQFHNFHGEFKQI